MIVKSPISNSACLIAPRFFSLIFIKQTIGSGEGEMFSLTKEENSNNLLISLLSKEKITFPHHIIKDIILF
jgi:hypothetical protein